MGVRLQAGFAMTFAIHASRDGQSVVTIRISPEAAVDKARFLQSLGCQVHITDSAGRQFGPSEFHQLHLIDRATLI
jgi:hypothetical protein